MKKEQTKQITFLQKVTKVSTVRILFGCIWSIDAFFKWQPAFQSRYLDILIGAAKDQPWFLKYWFDTWIAVISSQPHFFIYGTVLTETYIAIALLFGFAKKFTYVLALVFSLMIWATAEGFGGPYTAGATDIGTGIIYALVALSLLITDKQN